MGKALQEYLDIRFNKRKQEDGEGRSHKSLERDVLYSASLFRFSRGSRRLHGVCGGATFISARSATKARNENMCWTQEASLAYLFLFSKRSLNRTERADTKMCDFFFYSESLL